ncbi:hypothetical protein ACLBYD_04305 [Rhodococcus sp. C26F]
MRTWWQNGVGRPRRASAKRVSVRGDTVGETDESGTRFSGEDVMREFLGFFALLLVIGFVVSYVDLDKL